MKAKKHIAKTKWLMSMALVAGLSTSMLTSCNESVENLLQAEYPSPSVSKESKGKVLWIVLDGANGAAVKQANIQRKVENIRGMLDHAIYSFDGLADTQDREVNDSIAWANLMTSTSSAENVKKGQSVLSLMKQQGKTTALYAANAAFAGQYQNAADEHATGDDAAVTAKALEALAADEPKDFTIVELDGVKLAGDEQGYFDESGNTASDAVIKALHSADARIGQIMNVLKARKNYSSEHWLVMVTSNCGGVSDWEAENVYDRMDRKTFTLMYNQNVESKLYQRPSANDALKYEYYTLRYNGSGDTECSKVNDASLFDFTYDPEETDTNKITNYTVQFMYCHLGNKESRDEVMVGKAVKDKPSWNQGWLIKRRGWTFLPIVNGSWIYSAEQTSSNINDGIWHVMTIVFDYRNQVVSVFRDGERDMHPNNSKPKLDRNIAIGDVAPLTIGRVFNSSSKANKPFYVNNLQVYNVALPDDWIAKNYKMAHIDKKADTFKYWDNLIGYWPGDREEEYKGSVLHDYSKYGSKMGGINAGKSDMTITNPTWVSGASAEKNISPFINDSYYQKVINTRDLTYQSLQWMGIAIDADWKLSGIGRPFTYKK